MNWKVENKKLILELEFNTQTELAQFLVKVAAVSDAKNHHADATIYACSKLRLELYTHTINGISELDEELSKAILELI